MWSPWIYAALQNVLAEVFVGDDGVELGANGLARDLNRPLARLRKIEKRGFNNEVQHLGKREGFRYWESFPPTV